MEEHLVRDEQVGFHVHGLSLKKIFKNCTTVENCWNLLGSSLAGSNLADYDKKMLEIKNHENFLQRCGDLYNLFTLKQNLSSDCRY